MPHYGASDCNNSHRLAASNCSAHAAAASMENWFLDRRKIGQQTFTNFTSDWTLRTNGTDKLKPG